MNAQVLPTIAAHRRLVVSRMVHWFVPAKKVMLEMVDNAQVNFINAQAKSIDNACLKKDTDRLLFSEKNWRFSNFHRLEKRQNFEPRSNMTKLSS